MTMTSESKPVVLGTPAGKTVLLQIQPPQIRDPETSSALKDQMIAIAEQHQAKDLIVDFGRVEFMGSVGFLALMGLRRHFKDSNIIFFGMNDHLQEVFEVSKLTSRDPMIGALFATAETREEAQNLARIRPNKT
jgi:anti-anti-sigma factor